MWRLAWPPIAVNVLQSIPTCLLTWRQPPTGSGTPSRWGRQHRTTSHAGTLGAQGEEWLPGSALEPARPKHTTAHRQGQRPAPHPRSRAKTVLPSSACSGCCMKMPPAAFRGPRQQAEPPGRAQKHVKPEGGASLSHANLVAHHYSCSKRPHVMPLPTLSTIILHANRFPV